MKLQMVGDAHVVPMIRKGMAQIRGKKPVFNTLLLSVTYNVGKHHIVCEK